MTEKTFSQVSTTPEEQLKIEINAEKHSLQFQKEKTALKFYMLGKGYTLGLKALGFLERYSAHKKRKDGKTPEMHHMIRIAFSITQLPGIFNEELCIILALLHDVQEDENVTQQEIIDAFNQEIAEKNWKLTKKFCGVVKNKTEFMEALADDREASIVKGLDRCDNLENMIGIFTSSKINDYCTEGENLFLKMLHKAAKNFPEQQIAYYAVRTRMKRAIIAARHYTFKSECQERQKEMILNLQESLDSLNKDHHLISEKLAKIYSTTNSNTFEEHEMKIRALIGITIDSLGVNGQLGEIPDTLMSLDRKQKADLFKRISDSCNVLSKSTRPSKAVLEIIKASLGLSSFDYPA